MYPTRKVAEIQHGPPAEAPQPGTPTNVPAPHLGQVASAAYGAALSRKESAPYLLGIGGLLALKLSEAVSQRTPCNPSRLAACRIDHRLWRPDAKGQVFMRHSNFPHRRGDRRLDLEEHCARDPRRRQVLGPWLLPRDRDKGQKDDHEEWTKAETRISRPEPTLRVSAAKARVR